MWIQKLFRARTVWLKSGLWMSARCLGTRVTRDRPTTRAAREGAGLGTVTSTNDSEWREAA